MKLKEWLEQNQDKEVRIGEDRIKKYLFGIEG